MKTPREIARYTFAKMHSRTAKECENEVLAHIESGIESDRAQRDLYELIAEALDERANDGIHRYDSEDADRARKAAAAVRGEGGYQDPIWDMWIGPMLDQLERVYGD